jgi:hypothetical protein
MNEKVYQALANDPGVLGNKLHTHYIYEADAETQEKALGLVNAALEKYSDSRFLALAYDKDTRRLIQKLISLKREPNWKSIVTRFLKGMKHLLEREMNRADKLHRPKNIKAQVKKELKKIHIYHKADLIKVTEKKPGIVEVNYTSLKHSPEYNPKKIGFGLWRDTQLIFTLNFNKGIFVWVYINVHSSLRGQGMGTKLAKFCERLGKDIGFRRFSVEYPNRKYWIDKLGYDIPRKYRIGSGNRTYTHEGYKEI